MASRYGITQPNGVKFTLLYDEEQSKAELIERLILKPWAAYCLNNWLSDNHEQMDAPEHKVKRLLDRCGTLLLRDVPLGNRDTLTSYKEMMVGSREINLSACPEGIAEMAESGQVQLAAQSPDDKLRYQLLVEQWNERSAKKPTRRNPKCQTRFSRLERIRKENPGCRMEICRVDVDGSFSHQRSRYQVDVSEGRYAPKRTRYGNQYDMDRIIVILRRDGSRLFADQNGALLEDELVREVEG